MASEIPSTSAGIAAGNKLAVNAIFLRRPFMLVIPNANEVPNMTATIADKSPRVRVFLIASTNKGLSKAL